MSFFRYHKILIALNLYLIYSENLSKLLFRSDKLEKRDVYFSMLYLMIHFIKSIFSCMHSSLEIFQEIGNLMNHEKDFENILGIYGSGKS